MGNVYSKSSIENLKNTVDIVDVISRRVELKRAGANYKACCPFHKEKTPSFMVSESRQYFTCFGCGEKGDVFQFMMKYYNLDFGEAVEKLADEYGIRMEKKGRSDDGLTRLFEVNRLAARFFYNAMTSGPNPGYTYMRGRGLSNSTMKKFGIGYADEKWSSLYEHLKKNGVSDKDMLDLGLVSQKNGKCYDRFRNRVIFPIINTSGKVIGFGGRALEKDAQAKYLNSPESRVFLKKNNLYGLNITRGNAVSSGYMILVEGYMDAISLYQHGVENVAASCGTALTEEQARLLKRYTKDVVLSYDADAAGRKAALRGIEILRKEGLGVKVLHVTDGKDPDDFVKMYGKDAYLDLVGKALPYAAYKLESAKQRYELGTTEGKIAYLREASRIISALDPVEEDQYKRIVADDQGVSTGVLTREIESIRNKESKKAEKTRSTSQPADAQAEIQDVELTRVEKNLIRLFMMDSKYLDRIEKEPDLIESPFALKLFVLARDRIKKDGTVDVRSMTDELTDAEQKVFMDIRENVLIDPQQKEEFFIQCRNAHEADKLRSEERALSAQLDMAEDEEIISELQRRLMSVRNKILSLTGNA